MNKSILGVVIIAIFIVGAGGVYWFYSRPKVNEPVPTARTTDTLPNSKSSNINVKCVTKKVPNSVITMYINDFKNLRTDTQMQTGTKNYIGHMLYDREYMYQWVEEEGQIKGGIKSFSDFLNKEYERYDSLSKGQGLQATYIAMNKQADIDCEPWVVDESMFVLPPGVEFTEQATTSQSATYP